MWYNQIQDLQNKDEITMHPNLRDQLKLKELKPFQPQTPNQTTNPNTKRSSKPTV